MFEIDDLLPRLEGCILIQGRPADRWLYAGLGQPEFIPLERLWNFPLSPEASPSSDSAMPLRPPFPGGVLLQLDYPLGLTNRPHTPFRPARLDTIPGFQHAVAICYPQYVCYSFNKGCAFLLQKQPTDLSISSINETSRISGNSIKAPTSLKTLSNLSREAYVSAVRKAQQYIAAGDIYQINLATCFTRPWQADPKNLFRQLIGPLESGAHFGAYFPPNLLPSGHALCSASPELFLNVCQGRVVTRPIKGTCALTSAVDSTSARHMLDSSVKERAELNMIVDLERNDLGQVCNYGTVRVDSPGEIEEFPGLLHRVATVSGKLRPRTTLGELLSATFPGGSITGAPKRRAMELIAELEPIERGPYCGALGWLGWNGDLELSIAIRTATVDPSAGLAHYFAGAGIVADSDPESEYAEVLLKAQSFFRACDGSGLTP